jgi:DNA replication factor GINS
VNLEELRERRRRERQQDSLQSLSESFYGEVAEYLRELKTAREAAAEEAADPYGDPEVRRLTDELQTAESIVESLYERRVGKVVKHASFAAADMPHEREGLTEEERALFNDLVARIKQNRRRVLDTLAGEGGTEMTEVGGTEPSATPTELDEPASASESAPERPAEEAEETAMGRDDPAGMLADAMGVGGDEKARTDGAPSAAEATEHDPTRPPPGGPEGTGERDESSGPTDRSGEPDGRDERTTVRITADVGEIYGIDDRSYRLEADDVVDLPADNAAPLIEKEAAERL